MSTLTAAPAAQPVADLSLSALVRVDFGWWRVAGYDLVQVVSPRTALGTAWIVWRGDHLLHTADTLPHAGDWVTDQLTGGAAR
ncbi:hypothetical protein [Kribbella solani]|uniref:hypothetical protein n=1 Tax=Kribbella solani TaxID=236067 RepID=UPI0029B21747|nr:hypothetical protein [Kribbella solani]MDX2974608.1 hypothetical protein [Kribbella solani]